MPKTTILTMIVTSPGEDLLQRAASVKLLPTFAATIEKVLAILENRNASFEEITAVIRYDQALSGKIIGIANSAYYSRQAKIFSLNRAMMTIGLEEVKVITICLLLMNSILKQLNLTERDLANLWRHSVEVACAASLLARKTLVEDPQKTFTAGLLHDIGRIAFFMHAAGYRLVCERSVNAGRPLHLAEKELYGVDHQELGRVLSQRWRLPEEFGLVIGAHHGEEGQTPAEPLLRCVAVADRFFLSPEPDSGPEALLLSTAREAIEEEVGRIASFVRVPHHDD
jgi:putative nucleotidyltransferase with HDIG domain